MPLTKMGMKKDIRIPLTMLSISYLEKLPFKGSYEGKRFLFKKEISKENRDNSFLKVYLWKDINCFEKTDEKDMIIKQFDYSKEGIDEGLEFVEETVL